MASKLFSCCQPVLLVLSIVFIFSTPTSLSMYSPPSASVAPGTACESTPDPNYCKSVLPAYGSGNLYDYGRFSLSTSLYNAQMFLDIVNRYLAGRSMMPESVRRALEDCQLMSELNQDFLATIGVTFNSTTTLVDGKADSMRALLSALITNQETCLTGLQEVAPASSVKNVLYTPLTNGSKLYSMSLALARAWLPKKSGGLQQYSSFHPVRIPSIKKAPGLLHRRSLLFHEVEINQEGGLPLRMSESNRKLLESRTRVRILQSSSQVLVTATVVVSQDGTGSFTTIGAAVAAAPNNTKAGDGYFLISVGAGVYQEFVSIPKSKKYIMMIGAGINQTVITGDHNNADGWTTFNSATFAVVGEGFVAVNMTFRNTAGAAKHQAVALRSGADQSTFYSCSMEGYQDTLYTHSLRQVYRMCDIYGTVDFMFGNAAVVFQDCNIYARLPMQGQSNTITAQGRTDPNQSTGMSIQDCNVGAAPELASSNGTTATYLGRPWKQYSRTVVTESVIGGLIDPAGWLPWAGDFALSTLYYAEYHNSGPGSNISQRVTWPGYHATISSTDASNFTISSFIGGDNWLPQTGVPYDSGL